MICSLICTGDGCKAKVGPRPAIFHHFCYDKYCNTILNAALADDEDCNYCMDCRCPSTDVPPKPLMSLYDMTGVMTGETAPPAKRGRGGASGYNGGRKK